jgi:hypothetical protein
MQISFDNSSQTKSTVSFSASFDVLFSHRWYSIIQMAGKGVDSLSILQVHGDDPKDGKNWRLEVDKTKEGRFDEGYVSC